MIIAKGLACGQMPACQKRPAWGKVQCGWQCPEGNTETGSRQLVIAFGVEA